MHRCRLPDLLSVSTLSGRSGRFGMGPFAEAIAAGAHGGRWRSIAEGARPVRGRLDALWGPNAEAGRMPPQWR